MQTGDELKILYNKWYENNRPLIASGQWKLIDENILLNPLNDQLRGLNIIAFLPDNINQIIESKLVDKINKFGWIIPKEGRHITILDIIPHNSGILLGEQKVKEMDYQDVVAKTIYNFRNKVEIELEGIFASPDGITIQGFPVGEGLFKLREELRKKLSALGLVNLEEKKYTIQTAHVALIKFTSLIDGVELLKVVDSLRDVKLGKFEISELILSFSCRYDKIKSIEVVGKYKIRTK